jgi:NAD(P)-dependent dehydrogenase (short-subunit alcohol dehydrogenase family)
MTSSGDLSGRVALVTGGNSGLGRTMARAFVNAGARVAIGARRSARNAETVAELGANAAGFDLDVTDEASVAAAIAGTIEHFGRIDVLVNNAGLVRRESVLTLERSDWDRVLAVNLTGAFLCTKHAARHMAERKSGKVINIASIYGLVAPSKGRQIAYTAAKHGLIGLTKANAVELAPFGIQVNAIAPGYHFTEMVEELRGTAFEEAVRRRTPAGRWGEPNDLVGAAVFLASPASDFISGAVITVDGGYLASDGLDRQ